MQQWARTSSPQIFFEKIKLFIFKAGFRHGIQCLYWKITKHRIIALYNTLSWKGSFKVISPPGMRRDIFSLLRAPSNLTWNVPTGCGICHHSGPPVPVFYHSHSYNFFLTTYTNHYPLAYCYKSCWKASPHFSYKPPKILKVHSKVSPELSVLQAEQCQLFQPFPTGKVLQASDHFCGPSSEPAATHPYPSNAGGPELHAAF